MFIFENQKNKEDLERVSREENPGLASKANYRPSIEENLGIEPQGGSHACKSHWWRNQAK